MKRQVLPLLMLTAAALAGCGSSGTKTVTVTTQASTPTASITTTAVPSTTSTAAPTTTGAPTTTAQPPTAPVVHLATFKSPSGNIGCMIIGGAARCDIVNRSWSPPPRPASCPMVVDYGQGLAVGGSGPGDLVCAGDTTRDPTAAPLAYGTDTVIGAFRCASRTSGMTCTNADTGHGFFIAFQGYQTF